MCTSQEHRQTESETESADGAQQWDGIRATQAGTASNDTWLGRLLQAGGYEINTRSNRQMASETCADVYLESMEATGDPGNESNQVRNQTVQGTPVGQCEQGILGSRRKRYNAASGTHMQPSQSRLPLPDGLLCSIAQNVRNRRMPNGTYGGVRGRKTKVGGKLTTFVFLLLD